MMVTLGNKSAIGGLLESSSFFFSSMPGTEKLSRSLDPFLFVTEWFESLSVSARTRSFTEPGYKDSTMASVFRFFATNFRWLRKTAKV